MKLTFVNVGYGEAILLECSDESRRGGVFTMLIDGGSAEPAEFADSTTGRVPLADFLRDRGTDHVDCMVSTHIHEDHVCGLLPVGRALPPGELWQTLPGEFYSDVMRPLDVSVAQNGSQSKFLRAINDYQSLCRLTAEGGGAVRSMCAGDWRSPCPGLRCRVLAPEETRRGALESMCRDLFSEEDPAAFLQKLSALDARMNNFSLILRLEYRGTAILLPGDTNAAGYGGLDRGEMKARLFKVGHHGQRDGASPELLEAVQPEAVVCCASSDRRYNSADPGVLEMMAKTGAALYFSDCPPVPGLDRELPPHRALEFTVDGGGAITGRYLN